MKNPVSISIGIPAHNEEQNIKQLLTSIVSQKGNFVLEKIIVVCDGCTDGTGARAREVDGVQVINDYSRKGKPVRMNELFQMCQSDIVIIVDADITLADEAFNALISPFYNNSDIMLASGNLAPIPAKNFVGQMAFTAVDLWNSAINTAKNTDMYRCGGPLRAFRRPFYNQFVFPPLSADDVYPYFICKKMNYQFAYISEPLGSYKLPSTLYDFQKQMRKFLDSDKIHEQTFGRDFVRQFYTITPLIKFKALLKIFPRHSLSAIGYVISWLPIKLLAILIKPPASPVWDGVKSTK